ncbi:Receptor expression-enhancing protein 5 [Tyrophagus putrescentiae]|nr:Receptor expression-enhancing protein 5 [Tyrophagus putrescentiae]
MVLAYVKGLVYRQVFSLSYNLSTTLVVGTITGGYSTIIRASTLLYTLTPYTNDGNLLVQSLVSLEARTNISRRYLARAFLFILAGYFLFSNSVLDMLTHLLMFLYPSYRSYLLLQNVDRLSKEDLVDILKYWIFIGLFATVDFALGYLIPFVSVIKLIFIIQCVLPRRSPAVQLAHSHFVTPLYRHLEKNESIQQVNDYVASLASSLKANGGAIGGGNDHQD